MADYIDLADKFGFDSTLTASDTNQLIENISAIGEQASGSPNIKYFKTGTYEGNGNNTQNITGVGFTPNWGKVANLTGSVRMSFKSSTMDSNSNLIYDGTEFLVSSKGINLFIEDGFTVRDNTIANANGVVYHYVMGKGL